MDVEIQLVTYENLASRLLYYFAKLYVSTVKIKNDYAEARRTVIVAILDDDFKTTEKVKEMETKWRLMCKEHPELELTNKIEIVIIELKKVKDCYLKNKKDPKSQWLLFLDDTESKEVAQIMKKNKEIKEAVMKVHIMSKDEELQRKADLREKYIMDQKRCIHLEKKMALRLDKSRSSRLDKKTKLKK